MKHKISSIIFDLDGTLLDTLGGLADATNYVMQEHNFPSHSKSAVKKFVGNGMRMLLQRAAPTDSSQSCIDSCCASFKKYYGENWKNGCCPYEGIDDMVVTLQKQSVPLAILSNKPHQFTKLFAEYFFEENTFEIIYGQRDGFDKKPQPGVALEIAKQLGMTTEYILFIGDSAEDIQTGKNAGMKTAAVTWGFREAEILLEQEPDILLNHPSELFEHVIFTR